MDIDVLIEIAGVTDFAGDGDEMVERFGNRLGGFEGYKTAKKNRRERDKSCEIEADRARPSGGLCGLAAALIENRGRFCQPRRRVFLEIENLEIGNGGIAGIHLMALGEERLGEIVAPTGLNAFHLDQR